MVGAFATATRRPRAFAPSGRRATGPGRVQQAVLFAPVLLLTLAHWAWGANNMLAGQVLTVALAALLALFLSRRGAAQALTSAGLPGWPGALFAGVLIWTTLAVFAAPGGADPAWAWIDQPGVGALNRSAAVLEIVKLLGLGCIFAVGVLAGARRSTATFTLQAALAASAVWAVIALVSYLAGWQVADTPRLTGGFMSPNSAATVFGMLTVLAAADILRRLRTAPPGFGARMQALGPALAYGVLFPACLLLTASRMGVAATLLASAAVLIWSAAGALKRRPVMAVLATIALIVGLTLLGGDLLLDRIERVGAGAGDRKLLFAVHWRQFLEAPLAGHGLGSFNDLNTRLLTPETYTALWRVRAAHNVYLQWLTETGVVGFSLMALTLMVVMVRGVMRAGAAKPGQGLLRGAVAANVVVLAHGLTDYALQTPSIAAFWALLLGLQFAFGAQGD